MELDGGGEVVDLEGSSTSMASGGEGAIVRGGCVHEGDGDKARTNGSRESCGWRDSGGGDGDRKVRLSI